MRPEQPRVQSDAADPRGDEAGILARCHVAVRTATAGEQELAGPFAGGPQVVIDRLAGLLAQFKSDRPPSFPLPDSCAIRRVATAGDILDSDGDDIATTKLAVDCQIEHSQIASAALDLEFRPYRPDVFGSQRRLRAGQLSFVLRHSLWHGGSIHLMLHSHTPRLGYRGEKHEPRVGL
jgi:hypothetical protein